MTRWFAVITVAAIGLAVPAAAQQRGTVEVGVFGRGTLFDPSLDVTGTLSLGVRAAAFLTPRWLLDVDLSASDVDGLAGLSETSYRTLHLRASYLRPYSERGQLVAGFGLVGNSYGGAFDETDAGVSGLFGFRVGMGGSLVLRAEATLDHVPSPANRAGDNWIAGVQVGVGYRFGRP